tara:strand:- start:61 stop:501 length:441 start_codon:yes stop_codon:yes gene_type:complete
MGFKLSIGLSIALVLLAGAFKLYYDKAEAEKEAIATQLQQAMNNQQLLENTIAKQNADLEAQLAREKEAQARIQNLTVSNSEAMEEVNDLRGKFAKHDLNMLSMAKPELLQKMVNRGTKRVGEDLGNITDPHQFDEDNTTDIPATE